jgi:hypothetical protein
MPAVVSDVRDDPNNQYVATMFPAQIFAVVISSRLPQVPIVHKDKHRRNARVCDNLNVVARSFPTRCAVGSLCELCLDVMFHLCLT